MARFKLFLTYIYNFQSKFCFFFICSPFPQFHLLRRFVFFSFGFWTSQKKIYVLIQNSILPNVILSFYFCMIHIKTYQSSFILVQSFSSSKKKGNQKHCQGIVSIYDCINYITYIWDRLLFSLSLTKKIQLFTNRCFFR